MIEYSSADPAITTPPFAVGVVFNYVCVDPTRYRVEPATPGGETVTTCLIGDQFSLDPNPPTCVEACKLCSLLIALLKIVSSVLVFINRFFVRLV